MRTLFILFILLPLSQVCGQTTKQVDYVISYDFTSVQDTATGTHGQAREFLLLHADGESRFHSSNRHFNDSMRQVYHSAHPQYGAPKTQEEIQEAADHFMSRMRNWKKPDPVDYVIRKDFGARTFQNILPYVILPVQHMEGSLDLDWIMQAEQDTILGIPCSLAITEYGGRKYKVWYAPGIPIPDGPYVFNGLPGLIVKVKDDKGWYTFTLKELSVKPQERFWKEDYIPNRSRLITRKSYVDQCRKQKENPRIPPGLMNVSAEKILEVKERNKWRYFMLLESY